jgi:hypothetical protein
MTARIVRRLIRSLDAAGVVGVFCVLMVLPSAPDCPDAHAHAHAHAQFIPFGPICAQIIVVDSGYGVD